MGPLSSLSINTTKCLSYNIKIQFKGEEMVGSEKRTVLHFHPISDIRQWALQSAETSISFHSFKCSGSIYDVILGYLCYGLANSGRTTKPI